MQFHRVFTLVLVNAFIKDLNGRSEIILTKSAGDIILEYSTTMLESSITIQYHLDKQRNRLKKVMWFSRKECTYRTKNNQLHDTGSGMIAQRNISQHCHSLQKRQTSVVEQAHKGTVWQIHEFVCCGAHFCAFVNCIINPYGSV